jgi:Fur family ferric uptake transcriptional regulator
VTEKPTRRNTWQKDAVKHALGEAIGFVSAQQLHLVLRNHGSTIGLATVYRALADLATSGDADSLQSKDGELLYRACTTDHHHHLICRNCGKTVEIEAGQTRSPESTDLPSRATQSTSLAPARAANKSVKN